MIKRGKPPRRCGKKFKTRKAALSSPAGKRAGMYVPRDPCPGCGDFHVRKAPARPTGTGTPSPAKPRAARKPITRTVKPTAPRKPRVGAATGLPKPPLGFSAAVKLAVRTRSGGGDPYEAVCEACGAWLGLDGGQFQHIVARGMGGNGDPVINGAANAALLDGTPQSGCHGAAEAGEEEMRGFWLPFGADPRTEPMRLHDGRLVWRSQDGRYLDEPPGIAA